MRIVILTLLWLWCAAVWPAPVNVNTASAAELAQALDGIGPRLAERIVRYRTAHGPFKDPDQLMAVPYIGRRTLERIRADLIID